MFDYFKRKLLLPLLFMTYLGCENPVKFVEPKESKTIDFYISQRETASNPTYFEDSKGNPYVVSLEGITREVYRDGDGWRKAEVSINDTTFTFDERRVTRIIIDDGKIKNAIWGDEFIVMGMYDNDTVEVMDDYVECRLVTYE